MGWREWTLSDETKRKILERLRRYLGNQWRAFWMQLAREVYEAEVAFKEGKVPGFETGELRRDQVIEKLKAWAAPLLDKIPDSIEDALIWAAVGKVLDDKLVIVNQALDKDWVGKIEDWESQLAWPLELALGMDLDLDGIIGPPAAAVTPPLAGVAPALLALALLLGLGSDAQAAGHRYERYAPQPATDVAVERDGNHIGHLERISQPGPAGTGANVHQNLSAPAQNPPPVAVPGPRYQRYTPSPEASARQEQQRASRAASAPDRQSLTGLPPDVGIETWFGHQPARGGIDTGLGLMLRRGRAAVGGHVAANRVGLAAEYRRVGVNYLWDPRDGSRELGAYFAALAF